MKYAVSAFVLALGLVGCSDGSSSKKEAAPAPAVDNSAKRTDKPGTKKAPKPNVTKQAPNNAPMVAPVIVATEAPIAVPTEAPIVVPTETQVEETKVTPDAAPQLAPEILAVQGTYFDAKFHAHGVSRSLTIDGDRFVSIVRGLARGTLNVIAIQKEEGSVVVAENGAVNLVSEKSSCDDAPDFVKDGARLASYTNLKLNGDALAFTFVPMGLETTGSLAKVDSLTEPALEDGQTQKDACWYIGSRSLLRTFVGAGMALPASL